jgi:PAS domain S-box-containing protein
MSILGFRPSWPWPAKKSRLITDLLLVLIVTIVAGLLTTLVSPFDQLQSLIRDSRFQNLSIILIAISGSLTWFSCRRLIDAPRELAARKGADAELRQGTERFRIVFEEGPLGMAVVGQDYRFIKANSRLREMVGYSEEELTSLTFPEITHPDDIDKDVNLAQRLFSGEIPHCSIEKRYIKKNKEILWANLTVSVVRDEGGKPAYAVALIEDFTERRRTEEILQFVVQGTSGTIGEDFLRSIVRNLAAALKVHFAFVSELRDPHKKKIQLRALWRGTEFGENFEYNIEGTPCEHVMGKELACYPNNVQRLFPHDLWLQEADVESYLAIPLFDGDRKALGHLGVMHTRPLEDTSLAEYVLRIFAARCSAELERKRAEIALQQEKENYRRVVENINDALMVDDCDGRVLFANHKFLELFGLAEADTANLRLEDYVAPEWRSKLREYHSKRVDGGAVPELFEYEGLRKDGTRRWLEVAVSQVLARDSIVGTQSLIRDITERKELQRQILEISEQEKRRLGSDLHDGIGQQLTGIAFMVKSLEKDLSEKPTHSSDKVAEIVETVNDAISVTRGVARGLYSVSLEEGGLRCAFEDLAAQIEKMFNISCQLQLPQDVQPLIRDKSAANHLFRITQEAVHNAAKHGRAKHISIDLCRRKDEMVLELKDDGVGLQISRMTGGGTAVTCTLPDRLTEQREL